ncbi:MAG: VCBS repeat-containing protein, partial [Hymenobacteraceae bacterium]|nr:VCBS repeat-containing protein [Hymenobacteraceae bacterium]
MKKIPFIFLPALLGSVLLGGIAPVLAQGSPGPPGGGPGGPGPPAPSFPDPSITAVAPTYNAPAAALGADVQITFRKPVVLAGGSPLAVWGAQTGFRNGALTGSGTRQIRFNPAQDWRPGEEVTVLYKTSPATLDQAQPALALEDATVYRFRGATAPAAGPLTAAATPPTTGLAARQVEVADLDGDGDSDLVLVGTIAGGAGRVVMLRHDVAGYTAIATLPTTATAAIALGDYTNDGRAELLVSDAAAVTATITVYTNPGTGAFGAAMSSTVTAGPGARGLRVTDLNSDGLLDLLTVNTNGTISKRYNDGTGVLNTGAAILGATPTNTITGVRVVLPANVTNGGPDQALVATGNNVRYYFNNGAGNYFTSGVFIASGIDPVNDLATAELGGDSDVEILIATTTGLLLGRNSTSGYQLTTLLSGVACATAVPADVDGDGDLDILVPAPTANGLRVLRNDGTGTFSVETPLPLNVAGSQPAWVAAADLNGDGTLDAVTANGLLTNSSTVLLNTAPNGSRDAVVSTQRQLAGSYDNVTVTGTGTLVLGANLIITGTLTVQNGGTLRLAGYRLLGAGAVVVQAGATVEIYSPTGLEGDVQTEGVHTFSSGARYVFRGTEAQQSGSALISPVLDLVVNNPQGVTLTSAVAVTRAVILTDGNLTSNGRLTLLGAAAGTAQVINTHGIVVGAATMQRFIRPDANPGVGYRLLAAPVRNTTFADLTAAGFTPRVNALYNTNPAAVPAAAYPNIFGYDESRLSGVGASAAFGRGYFSPTALTAPMVPGKGYSVAIRPTSKPDFTGILNTDSVASAPLTRGSTPESGWQLLGNPYPSPLNWDSVAATLPATMSKQVSVFRYTSATSGVYVTRLNGVSTPDPNGVLADGWLGAMQGFFVQ